MDLRIATVDGETPRGWQCELLNSPKFIPSPTELPLLILFFRTGLFLGGTWNEIGPRVVLCETLAQSKHGVSTRAYARASKIVMETSNCQKRTGDSGMLPIAG